MSTAMGVAAFRIAPARRSTRIHLYTLVALCLGLLSFPSISTSGAEIPHPHSVFALASHHHDHDGEIAWTPPAPKRVTDSADQTAYTGPSMQPTIPEFVNGDPVGPALSGIVSPTLAGSLTPMVQPPCQATITERQAPEPPPPRV